MWEFEILNIFESLTYFVTNVELTNILYNILINSWSFNFFGRILISVKLSKLQK